MRVALAELLMSGCTTASDHLFVFPSDLSDAIDIEAEEAAALGMRVTLTRGAINLGTKSGGVADERLMQSYDAVIADCERVLSPLSQTAAKAPSPQSGAGAVRAVQRDAAIDGRHGRAGAKARLPACTPISGKSEDEDDYCLRHFRMSAGRLPRGGRLAERARLARARRPFQR